MKKIWLVTIGEPVPIGDNVAERVLRTGQFAGWLSARAKVVWWTSAFDHLKKQFLVDDDTDIQINDRLLIRVFKGIGYQKNISIKRFVDHALLAQKIFKAMQRAEEKPDIILCSMPPLDVATASVRFGIKHNVPVLLDLRDMWPDIFVDHAPKYLRKIAKPLLFPLFKNAKRTFGAATGLIGITNEFLEWGVQKVGRSRSLFDSVFPFTYASRPPDEASLVKVAEFWDSKGIKKQGGIFRILFLGTLNRQFDVPTVVKASSVLRQRGIKAQFILCGAGDNLDNFKQLARGNPDVIFPGWVDAAAIYILMRRSSVGLVPLLDRYDFLSTINNKSVEYLSAGLPIVSCPKRGALFKLLKENNCGQSYNYGDSDGLADIVSGLAAKPALVREMSDNSIKKFNADFASEDVNARFLRHLEFVIDKYGAGNRYSSD